MAKVKKAHKHTTHYIREDGKEIFFNTEFCKAKRKGIRNINALPNYTKRRQVTGTEEE